MFLKLCFSLLMPLPFIAPIPTFHVGYDSAIPKLKYNNHALSTICSFLVVIANMSSKFEDPFLVGESVPSQ